MSGSDESSLYSRINYVHSPDGNFSVSVRIIKTMHTGFRRTRIALCQRPGADTEETGRYDLCVERLCSVLMLSVNSNELSRYSNIFMFMDICNPSKLLL